MQGSLYGSVRYWADLPIIARLYREGKLPLDKLITHDSPELGLWCLFGGMRSKKQEGSGCYLRSG